MLIKVSIRGFMLTKLTTVFFLGGGGGGGKATNQGHW